MYVPFQSLPGYSRIWIYQASRLLSSAEEKVITDDLVTFCEEWKAHGNVLRTSFLIDHHLFIVLSVDEDVNAVSGCSIDGSVRVLKSLEQKLAVNLLDRSQVAFLVDDDIKIIPQKELKQAVAVGTIDGSTPTFQILAPDKQSMEAEWLVPTEKTWLARYLSKTAAG